MELTYLRVQITSCHLLFFISNFEYNKKILLKLTEYLRCVDDERVGCNTHQPQWKNVEQKMQKKNTAKHTQ